MEPPPSSFDATVQFESIAEANKLIDTNMMNVSQFGRGHRRATRRSTQTSSTELLTVPESISLRCSQKAADADEDEEDDARPSVQPGHWAPRVARRAVPASSSRRGPVGSRAAIVKKQPPPRAPPSGRAFPVGLSSVSHSAGPLRSGIPMRRTRSHGDESLGLKPIAFQRSTSAASASTEAVVQQGQGDPLLGIAMQRSPMSDLAALSAELELQ